MQHTTVYAPITLKEIVIVMIILDITQTESVGNEKKKWFCFFTDGKQQKAREEDMITLKTFDTTVIHDMFICDFKFPWHDNCKICS